MIVDAAVIDVSSFAKRHPGGARLIMNSMGTDVTSEIIGEDASVGNSSMAFAPHPHSDVSSALGSEAGAVERGTSIIGGGGRGYSATVGCLLLYRPYRAAMWSFSSCHRSHALVVQKCDNHLVSLVSC